MEGLQATIDGVDYELYMTFDVENFGRYAAMKNDDDEVVLFKYQETQKEITIDPVDDGEYDIISEVFEKILEDLDEDDFDALEEE